MAAGHSPIFACRTPISKPILIWERKPATDEKYPYGGVKSTDTPLRHVPDVPDSYDNGSRLYSARTPDVTDTKPYRIDPIR